MPNWIYAISALPSKLPTFAIHTTKQIFVQVGLLDTSNVVVVNCIKKQMGYIPFLLKNLLSTTRTIIQIIVIVGDHSGKVNARPLHILAYVV